MTEPEILELLVRIENRDESALTTLFREYAARLMRFVSHRATTAANPAWVEEIVMDTFWEVWKQPTRFDRTCRFSTWLHAIAWNKTLHRLRQERRWEFLHATDEANGQSDCEGEEQHKAEPADPGADPLGMLLLTERSEALLRCADRLSPEQRQCLYLVHIEGMSHSEVAQVLGVPLNTVKSRVRLAIARMLPCVERALRR